VSEFDELVALDGVLMAGRLGPDGRVAEHKAHALYIANPAAADMALWFCAAITTMLGSMAYAIDSVTRTAFNQTSWLPVKGWAVSGGDYMIAMRGDRFVIAERAKIGSLDEVSHLVGNGQP
jgi:roadblock/LC7 domain-containing protein